MSDFLLELRSEEIPARMQKRAREDLARLFEGELAEAGLETEAIETFSTPRRLALIARRLPTETQAVSEERRGPRADAPDKAIQGFLRGAGMTRDQLEEREEKKGTFLYAVIETPGRKTRDVLAEAIPKIVRIFPWPKSMRWGEASASSESLRWVRPLQGIVAIFGDDLVACEVGGVESGFETVGHRFHHPGAITIGGAHDYSEKLEACHVIVDHKRREGIIRARADALAEEAGLRRVQDTALVQENAGLTEWPVPLLGGFDKAFLDVAPEAITLAMRTHQKYFACEDGEGNLAPNFICVANIETEDGGEAIRQGNERVLAARLADARFFWEQDLATPLAEQAKKLDQIVFHEKLGTVADKVERVAKLARWLVEEGIVTPNRAHAEPVEASDSSLRQAQGERVGELEALADKAEQAARLAKADLVTGTVGEFPELQGIVGGYLAETQGLDPEIAAAISDHYKPVGQGDEVPTAPVTVAVSLADKLDTVFSFFGIGKPPSGSKDPFALRRAAISVSRLLENNSIAMSFERTLDAYHGLSLSEIGARVTHFTFAEGRMEKWVPDDDRYPEVEEFSYPILTEADVQETFEPIVWHAILPFREFEDRGMVTDDELKDASLFTTKSMEHFFDDVLDFFADRLKVQQREAGVRHDLIDAVFALGGEDDLVRLLARVRALQAFLKTSDGANLLAGYKRAANILKKEGRDLSTFARPEPVEGSDSTLRQAQGERGGEGAAAGALGYDPQPEENILREALDRAERDADAAIEAEDFAGAMAALAKLRKPIDAFFDHVTVNDENAVKRAARLALLARFRDAVHRVADFSRIEG